MQAQVLELLADLPGRLGLTFLFIGHDLAVIQRVSHQEYRPAAEVFVTPQNAYTRDLLAAVPPARPRLDRV